MLQIIHAIRRNFEGLPKEDQLIQQANKKVYSDYPAILEGKRPSKKRQIDYYRKETEAIKGDIYNLLYHDNVPKRQELQVKALNKFEQSINNIREALENNQTELYPNIKQAPIAEILK